MKHSFAKTGLHVDLRAQVLPMKTLRRLAERVASQGHNVLVLEWEGTFPFDKHAVISNRYAYTRKEIARFIDDCTRWGLEVIPLQQCFGHLEYILQHKRYAHLRESQTDLCQLCPSKIDEALEVFSEIFREMAALHPAGYFHIGGDETYLLGHCAACRARAEEQGKSRLYTDFLRRMAGEVRALGKRPMLWIDMLLKYPESAPAMPAESIFVDWNYGWPLDRFGDFQRLREMPFEFWGAPAMRSGPDNHSTFSWRGHFENFRDYIPAARSMNFQGMVLTSWSTSGMYGYDWETHGEVAGLLPIRRVYPHAGLPILSAAFAEAVRSESALDVGEFIRNYAIEHFGFDAKEAGRFRRALMLSSHPPPKPADPLAALKDAQAAKRTFGGLSPRKEQAEFAHYRLIADMLEHHLRFTALSDSLQKPDCPRARFSAVRRKLPKLLAEARALNKRFAKLNTPNFHAAEMREEGEYRLKAIRALQERLENNAQGKSRRARRARRFSKKSSQRF